MKIKKRCYFQKSNTSKIGYNCDHFLWRGSDETDIFFLPFDLRAARTFRPFAEAIRSRKPCLFLLFLFDGWNVLFIMHSHGIVSLFLNRANIQQLFSLPSLQ